jgi:2'-5' RNA ligase
VDFEASEKLVGLLRALSQSGARLRVVEPEKIHITLKFLGNVDEGVVPSIVEVMRRSVEGIESFRVHLRGSGAFPSLRAPRVLWVGVQDGEPLITLAQRLEKGLSDLGFPREKRRFTPHITVARVKGPGRRERLARIMEGYREEIFGEQLVEDIRLKRSQLRPEGAVYTELARVPLG